MLWENRVFIFLLGITGDSLLVVEGEGHLLRTRLLLFQVVVEGEGHLLRTRLLLFQVVV